MGTQAIGLLLFFDQAIADVSEGLGAFERERIVDDQVPLFVEVAAL